MDGSVTIKLKDYELMKKRIERYEETEKRITGVILDELEDLSRLGIKAELLKNESIDIWTLCQIFKLEDAFERTFRMLGGYSDGN